MKFTITREQLQEGLAAVAAAIPAKTTLPVLANVLVEASKQAGGVRLSGTDLHTAVSTTVRDLGRDRTGGGAGTGARRAKARVPGPGGAPADLIVPPKALEQVRRLYPGDAEIELAKSDNHIGFRAGGTLVFSRLIEGPYPNYEQVIPRENDKQATVDKLAMSAALRRMSVVASDQTHRIRLEFSGGTVKF